MGGGGGGGLGTHSMHAPVAPIAPIAAAQEIIHPVSKRPTVHDWRGDYVAEAVSTGRPLVLELLFKEGYKITWQNAQVGPTPR